MPGVQSKKRNTVISMTGRIMFICITACLIFLYYTQGKTRAVNYTEVIEGSLVKEHNYTGFILRDETTVTAESSGFLYYFVQDRKKLPVGSLICCLDPYGDIGEYLNRSENMREAFSKADTDRLKKDIQNASAALSDARFSRLYSLKDSLNLQLSEFSSHSILPKTAETLAGRGVKLDEYRTQKTGTVCCYTDGCENLSVADINRALLESKTDGRVFRKAGDYVEKGEVLCKLVTSENWKIVFEMTDEDAALFNGKSGLRIRFPEENLETSAEFSTIKSEDGSTLGILRITKYMVQFADRRTVAFEIITNDVSGLKIPEKSILTRNTYVLPAAYLSRDNRGNQGFYKILTASKGDPSVFVVPDILCIDDEYVYIEAGEGKVLAPGDQICMPEDGSRVCVVGTQKELEGVYNLNKGFPVFKRIVRLETANGYAIIEKNTPYGLSVYDHILLDASTVSEAL